MDKYGYIGIETLLNFCENSKDHAVTPNDFMRMNRARVPERKTGKWIEQDDGWDGVYYECSVCKEAFTLIDGNPSDNLYNFCPNCGADMRDKEGVQE